MPWRGSGGTSGGVIEELAEDDALGSWLFVGAAR
jgi:hypothetical protein